MHIKLLNEKKTQEMGSAPPPLVSKGVCGKAETKNKPTHPKMGNCSKETHSHHRCPFGAGMAGIAVAGIGGQESLASGDGGPREVCRDTTNSVM